MTEMSCGPAWNYKIRKSRHLIKFLEPASLIHLNMRALENLFKHLRQSQRTGCTWPPQDRIAPLPLMTET